MQESDTAMQRASDAARQVESSRPQPHAPLTLAVNAPKAKRGWLARLWNSMLCFFFPRRARTQEARPHLIASASQKAPVVFKAGTAHVAAVPAYAGRPYPQNLRLLAEEEFHLIKSSEGATIN